MISKEKDKSLERFTSIGFNFGFKKLEEEDVQEIKIKQPVKYPPRKERQR